VVDVTNVRAVGPNGDELDAEATGARTATFQTAGQGRHYLEVEFRTAAGNTGTLTHRVKAASVDQSMPPGVRLKDTPFGTMAVVGDGFESGAVEMSNGGTQIDVTAQVPADGDAPASMHLYAHALSMPPSTTMNIDVVRGDAQERIQRNVEVTAHLPALTSENAVLYRGSDAMPREGEGRIADVVTTDDETTITTVTDADGEVSIETNNNPGPLDRMGWWLDRNSPDFSLGLFQSTAPVIPLDIGTPTWDGPVATPAASASLPTPATA